MLDFTGITTPNAVSLAAVAVNLAICAALSLVLSWHFGRFAARWSSRRRVSRSFLALSMTTSLVIGVVKSSLALSLGLVGALSIVRFRTPIKEPEELAYIFLAIAIGLGTGADQAVVTALAVVMITALMSLMQLLRSDSSAPPNVYVNVDLARGAEGDEVTLERLLAVMSATRSRVDLRRYDSTPDRICATFDVQRSDSSELMKLESSLREAFPEASLSFVENELFPNA